MTTSFAARPTLSSPAGFVLLLLAFLLGVMALTYVAHGYFLPWAVAHYQTLAAALQVLWSKAALALPVVMGLVGVLWTVHILKRPVTRAIPQTNTGVTFGGGLFTVVASIVYYATLPQLVNESSHPLFVAALYVSMAALLFPLSVEFFSDNHGCLDLTNSSAALVASGVTVIMSVAVLGDGPVARVVAVCQAMACTVAALGAHHFLFLFERKWVESEVQKIGTEAPFVNPPSTAICKDDVEEQAWA